MNPFIGFLKLQEAEYAGEKHGSKHTVQVSKPRYHENFVSLQKSWLSLIKSVNVPFW